MFGERCHLGQISKFCNSLCESNCRLDTNVNVKIEAKNDECKIEEISNLHKEKHFKFVYYCWVAKHVVTQVRNNARKVDLINFNKPTHTISRWST